MWIVSPLRVNPATLQGLQMLFCPATSGRGRWASRPYLALMLQSENTSPRHFLLFLSPLI